MNPSTFVNRTSRHSAFTLIELLAVVAIVLLLISLLVPALQHSKEVSLDVVCKSNLRQMASMAVNFAQDHNGVTPSGRARTPEILDANDPLQQCFMGNEVLVGTTFENARLPAWPSGWPIGNSVAKPTWGTLYPYMGGDARTAKKLYRCIAQPEGVLQSGVDSNGFFDYSVQKGFMLATIGNIPSSSLLEYPERSGIWIKKPTPFFMEENAATINSRGYIEPGGAAADRVGTWHYGHGNYASLNGSVSTLETYPGKTYGPNTGEFKVTYPSGNQGPFLGGNGTAPGEFWNNN